VIFAKSAVHTKIRLFFRYRVLFCVDTVQVGVCWHVYSPSIHVNFIFLSDGTLVAAQ
jgi:hypothetical protein